MKKQGNKAPIKLPATGVRRLTEVERKELRKRERIERMRDRYDR